VNADDTQDNDVLSTGGDVKGDGEDEQSTTVELPLLGVQHDHVASEF